ncbi:type I-F CRISPR-associated endoribonuclease Cas6/Csy4 [Photobacterium leiognathi]|uniref:type I-F CRISPR-associated endoribonuclease Cas6/Csy4 n=1 Tax=Photobacterium leiognathi TaxID=553611 RepID=UPI002981F77E|nr:type I-F CRISPR-associated endoribonuclease Cas6/Csy4 [Photobacterium leiognathi]
MNWYYKTITFLPERCDHEVLVAKCLSILHGFNYKYNTRSIGVSFPEWCDDTVGKKISFISMSRIELDLLLKHQYFAQMRNLSYFDISTTNQVPDDCEYVSFIRNQSIDKSTPAGQTRKLRRLEKRAISRQELFTIPHIKQRESIVLPHYHSIEINSQSKSSFFRLNIQMKAEQSLEGSSTFSSYGLSNSENSYQPVPFI